MSICRAYQQTLEFFFNNDSYNNLNDVSLNVKLPPPTLREKKIQCLCKIYNCVGQASGWVDDLIVIVQKFKRNSK